MVLPLLALAVILPTRAKIDAFLDRQFRTSKSPGMSVAIVREGRVIYAKGFGEADVQNRVPARTETVYRLGSVTKQFTATMVMQLVGEDKVRLDDPIRTYLPDLPVTWEKVTVRELLNHTSGIPNYTDEPDFLQKVKATVKPRQIIADIEKKPLDFAPGTKWNYSNSGYEVLGYLIEKIDGATYEAALRKRILDPLGMRATYFTSNETLVPHRAAGYQGRDAQLRNAGYLDMGWPYAAGSMESTVLDLAKWDAALAGERILRPDLLTQMWEPTKLSGGGTKGYGFGWALAKVPGSRIVSHSGGIHGFLSDIHRALDRRLTAIVLMNSDSPALSPTTISARLLAFLDPTLSSIPATIPDSDPSLSARLRKAVEAMAAGKPDFSEWNEGAEGRLAPNVLASIHSEMESRGPLRSFALVEANDQGGVRRRVYLAKFGETFVQVTAELDANGKIRRLSLSPREE